MIRATIKCGFGLFALLALSACANLKEREEMAGELKQCRQTETLTCDRFNGENHNCTCERGGNLRDMLDAYQLD